jgi:hypothetical protein
MRFFITARPYCSNSSKPLCAVASRFSRTGGVTIHTCKCRQAAAC